MVGAHGETLIVNWGRAREMGACTGETQPADPRSDVHALGTVLYFTLTGRAPQEGASPPPLTSVEPSAPADLAAIVARATAPDPADRYADAGELAEDLKRFANGRLVRAHTYSLAARAGRWARRRLGALVVAAAALLALVSIGVVSFVRVAHQRDAAVAAQQRARTLNESGAQVIGFLVDRLYPRLQARGRLQALVGLGAQVERYYDALAQDPIDSATLSQRAGALALLADVERDRGNRPQAERLYGASLAMMEEHRSRFGDEAAMRERRSQIERRLHPAGRP
jgi:serine/threonine-protein kinase